MDQALSGESRDLVGSDPNQLVARLERITRSKQDPCVEDVLRCAAARAEHPDPPERWRAWHRWKTLRGAPAGSLPKELRGARR
jgi:hypothetical protein